MFGFVIALYSLYYADVLFKNSSLSHSVCLLRVTDRVRDWDRGKVRVRDRDRRSEPNQYLRLL